MNSKPIPFWEESYQNMENITFSNKPNKTIQEIEGLLKKDSNILEVGCGEGQTFFI